MKSISEPTNPQNASSRLFLRFCLYYIAAFVIGLLLTLRDLLVPAIAAVGAVQLIFFSLAFLGALLTITKPYLCFLTLLKGGYDAAVLYCVTSLTQSGTVGILPWNACFFSILLTVVLFMLMASNAACFNFFQPERDLKLIFSRNFGHFLIRSLILFAIALSLYFLWPRIYETFAGI